MARVYQIRPEGPKERIAGRHSVSPPERLRQPTYLGPERAKESPPQADKKRERLRKFMSSFILFKLLDKGC